MDILLPIVEYHDITNEATNIITSVININEMNFISAIESTIDYHGADMKVTEIALTTRTFTLAISLSEFSRVRHSSTPLVICKESVYSSVDDTVELNKIMTGLLKDNKNK